MRANGVSAFPDPNASGELTIDAVANGSSLDTSSAAFEEAMSVCKDLEPPGFTGDKRSPEQQAAALEFAQCIRENGVKDFPDPAHDAPLVDTRKIPSSAYAGWYEHSQRRDAEVRRYGGGGDRGPVRRKTWAVAAAVVLVAAAATGGVVAMSGAEQATPAAQEPPVNTETVERGKLSDMVSQYGTLAYRARSDGSPFAVINRARGTYTELPEAGDNVDCGDVLYRVDDKPVLLLCGSTPAYRVAVEGRQRTRRHASSTPTWCTSGTRPERSSTRPPRHFGSGTASALEKLQSKLGEDQTGSLKLGQAVFLPESVRIATGDRRARWDRPAGCTARAGHIRHARGAGGTRSVAAG